MSSRDSAARAEFHFVLADSIDFLNPAHWDGVVLGSGIFLTRAFLELIEANLPEKLSTHYALIYRGQRPVAAVVAQSLEIRVADLPADAEGQATTGWWRSFGAATERSYTRVRSRILVYDRPAPGVALHELWPEVASDLWHRVWSAAEHVAEASVAGVHQRFLVCGNLLSWGPHGVAFAPGEDPRQLWPAVVEALARIQDANHGKVVSDVVMFKDLTEDQAGAGPILRRHGFRRFETEPNMVLRPDPSWRSFDDYLQALRSDYRRGIHRTLAELESAGIVLERLLPDQVQESAAEIQSLYLQVHHQQKLRLIDIHPNWITSLAWRFQSDFRTVAARGRSGGPLLGFITLIRDGDGVMGYYVGFDKEVAAKGVPLYLGLFYAALDEAFQMGAKRISLGRTALGPKAQVGAKAQAMYGYLRHQNPALNLAVPGVLALLPVPEQAPARHPFRA